MSRPDYLLFDRNTRAIIVNYQQNAIQRMFDFDFACGREKPSVAAIVNPTRGGHHKAFFGSREVLIPMYRLFDEAANAHPDVDVVINFMSYRSAYESSKTALNHPNIRTVAIIAEGVPERQARKLIQLAKAQGKWIIGPATVGGIAAGAFKIGNTGGTIDNIITSKLYRAGPVGLVTKSGGMVNEMFNIIARNAGGVFEGIAIGGDSYPGNTLVQHLERMNANPAVKMLVCLGEVGGDDEYLIVEALREGRVTKPLVMWVTGTCARMFPSEVQFGHAGARADSDRETAQAKNAALAEAGAIVPESFDDFGQRIRETCEQLMAEGVITPTAEPAEPRVPLDFLQAMKGGLVRKSTSFISTISDDRGEELTYRHVPISRIFREEMGVGGVLSLLWFKKELPAPSRKLLEMVLMLTADHGPAVSGAHNAIVAARAGKDLVSAVASGLLTIGPRFGGAIDDAARWVRKMVAEKVPPAQFVVEMKKKGINIPGIGHRVKSIHNPDMRVTILKEFAKANFASTAHLDYALEVEKITTRKKGNLILNVDGCIGICMVDMMTSSGDFTSAEVQDYLDIGVMNGLFVLGRTIGLIGHVLDQKRLKQPLYRHPWDDIAYLG